MKLTPEGTHKSVFREGVPLGAMIVTDDARGDPYAEMFVSDGPRGHRFEWSPLGRWLSLTMAGGRPLWGDLCQ